MVWRSLYQELNPGPPSLEASTQLALGYPGGFVCSWKMLIWVNVLHKNNIWLENVTVDIWCAKIYIIPLIHLFWPKISEEKNLYRPLKFIGMYWTKNNVSKKRHRYNHEFNIILTSEMLLWNCFRLLTAKFTTFSFTMPLKGEITFPAKNGHCTSIAVTIWS